MMFCATVLFIKSLHDQTINLYLMLYICIVFTFIIINYNMTNTINKDLTSVDYGQEAEMFVEVELLQYELAIKKVAEEEWKQYMFEKCSYELKVFIIRNVKLN